MPARLHSRGQSSHLPLCTDVRPWPHYHVQSEVLSRQNVLVYVQDTSEVKHTRRWFMGIPGYIPGGDGRNNTGVSMTTWEKCRYCGYCGTGCKYKIVTSQKLHSTVGKITDTLTHN